MLSQAHFVTKRDRSTDLSVNEFMLAYKKLAHLLHHGFVGEGLHRVPVAGDTTKLPYVKGLTRLERKLAWAQNFIAQHMQGTQQLRQLMGHTQSGARVVYGDCIFFTVSPNEQHSALVLRLSRYRANDPILAQASASLAVSISTLRAPIAIVSTWHGC